MTNEHSEPLQLPAAGDTTPTQRVGGDHGHGTTLSLKEAAERLGIHEQTVRRAVKAGRVPGAHTVPHGKGEQWRVPVASLEAIRPQAAPQVQQVSELGELRKRVGELEAQLAVQRALADERDRALTQLHATVRALGAGLQQGAQTSDADRADYPNPLLIADALKAELEALKAKQATQGRRRWWKRNPGNSSAQG